MGKTPAVLNGDTVRGLEKMGTRIRQARLRRNMTAEELSLKSDVSISTIWSIEKGSSTVSIGKYAAVLEALNLEKDFDLIASNDTYGRILQDNSLPKRAGPHRKRPVKVTVKSKASTT